MKTFRYGNGDFEKNCLTLLYWVGYKKTIPGPITKKDVEICQNNKRKSERKEVTREKGSLICVSLKIS